MFYLLLVHIFQSMSRADKQASGASTSRNQRPILPKPSTATSGGHVVSDSSLDGSGKGIIGEGRQGPIIDVQSIIADYRSQHPENVPRRGRRMKPSGMVSRPVCFFISSNACTALLIVCFVLVFCKVSPFFFPFVVRFYLL